jgi:ATP-dependent helicase HrpA
VDQAEGVGVALLESERAQAGAMWGGTRRLLKLAAPLSESHLQRRLTKDTRLALARSDITFASLAEDCATAVIDQIIVGHGGPAYTRAGFELMATRTRDELPERVPRLMTIAGGVMAAAEMVLDAADRLERRHPGIASGRAGADVRHQVEGLVHPGFVTEAGPARLRDVLRYLDAAGRRLERLPNDLRRDGERQAVVERLLRRYETLVDRAGGQELPAGHQPAAGPELAALRWQIEELRVSLWAQSLGTAETVSEARISRQLERFGA